MLVTPRGLFAGGDATTQGGYNVGRVAFYDFNSIPAPGPNETTIINPIEGRVERPTCSSSSTAPPRRRAASSGSSSSVQDRDTNRYLQDDLTTWGAANTINVNLASPNATSTTWSLPLTISGNRRLQLQAKTFGVNGSSDATKAIKRIETFGLADQTPTTTVTGPQGSVIPTTTFTVTGTAQDDVGVNSITFTIRDSQNRYLQDDGTTSTTFNTFRGLPDVVGATNATWSYEVTVPVRGRVDDAGDRRRHRRSVRPAQRGRHVARERHRGPADGDDRHAGGDDPADGRARRSRWRRAAR